MVGRIWCKKLVGLVSVCCMAEGHTGECTADPYEGLGHLEAELKTAREENARLATDKMHHALAGEIADLRAAERELKTQLTAERTRREAAERLAVRIYDFFDVGNYECEHGFMLDKCPNENCEEASIRREYDAIANQGKEDA